MRTAIKTAALVLAALGAGLIVLAFIPSGAGSSPVRDGWVELAPETALGDQAAVDEGGLVTWMTEPACLLAGHDYAGWAWMSEVPTGTRVEVTTGPCAGTYEVYGHRWQGTRGGAVPAWVGGVDLVLQTCEPIGSGFTLARRV